MKRAIFAFLFVLSACVAARASQTLEQRIDPLFAAYDVGDRPGYAIGIVEDGTLVFSKGYGLADLGSGTPITAETSFNLASLSKQFTGAALALELQKGTVDLDDPLHMHWDDLPEFMGNITLGHLAYMTSGLTEYYNLPSPRGGWASEDEFTVDDAIAAVFASGQVEYSPGTRWTYSNINYQLLAEVTAGLNGTTFSSHINEAVFEPLGMTRTWVDAPLDNTRPGTALSYNWSDDLGDWDRTPRLSPHYGGSGVYSSLSDLARWDFELYRSNQLGEEFSDFMLATRAYQHDKTNDALGLVYGSYRSLKTIWYEGGDYGVSTYMVHLPERGQTVICLANFGDARCANKARAVIDVLLAFDPAE